MVEPSEMPESLPPLTVEPVETADSLSPRTIKSLATPESPPPLTVEPMATPESFPPLMVEPVKKFGPIGPILAWIIILGCVALVVVSHIRPSTTTSPAEAGDGEDLVTLRVMQAQGKFYLGIAALSKDEKHMLYEYAKKLDEGTVDQRLRYIVLAGELGGPEAALDALKEFDAKLAKNEIERNADDILFWAGMPFQRDFPSRLTALERLADLESRNYLNVEQSRLREILGRVYTDYADGELAAPSVGESDRALLKARLNWFGDLALAPDDGPDQNARDKIISSSVLTTVVLIVAGILAVVVAVAGLIGLIVFLILLLSGRLQHLKCVSFHGGVYAETFAVWMILFIGISISFGRLFGHEQLLPSAAGSLLSLVALFWPVLRGVPWRRVREDVGLSRGRNPRVEPVLGLGTYILSLPLVALGVLIMVVLMAVVDYLQGGEHRGEFGPLPSPSHPIVHLVAGGDWWMLLQVLFLAGVIAPIVEETMFRGVLYRHLRETTRSLGFVVSAFLSAITVSFMFAVIHPQGPLFVPVLMGLAFGFTLAREWRGTLIPSIIAHGLNNTLVLCLNIFLLGS
jgi:membrane protease YdiL (CAAX protease family)